MANPDFAALAIDLGNFCNGVAAGLGNFLDANIGNLPADKVTSLKTQIDQMTAQANKFFELADGIAFAALATNLQGVQDATAKIQQDLKTIANIDKAIAIATAVIELGTAIFTMNGSALGAAVTTIGSI
jgi:hypothetical protein